MKIGEGSVRVWPVAICEAFPGPRVGFSGVSCVRQVNEREGKGQEGADLVDVNAVARHVVRHAVRMPAVRVPCGKPIMKRCSNPNKCRWPLLRCTVATLMPQSSGCDLLAQLRRRKMVVLDHRSRGACEAATPYPSLLSDLCFSGDAMPG